MDLTVDWLMGSTSHHAGFCATFIHSLINVGQKLNIIHPFNREAKTEKGMRAKWAVHLLCVAV